MSHLLKELHVYRDFLVEAFEGFVKGPSHGSHDRLFYLGYQLVDHFFCLCLDEFTGLIDGQFVFLDPLVDLQIDSLEHSA